MFNTQDSGGTAVTQDLPLMRQTLTVEEFATLAGIGRSTAYEAARSGEIPARRIGSRFVIPVAMARQWLGDPDPSASSVPSRWYEPLTLTDQVAGERD